MRAEQNFFTVLRNLFVITEIPSKIVKCFHLNTKQLFVNLKKAYPNDIFIFGDYNLPYNHHNYEEISSLDDICKN